MPVIDRASIPVRTGSVYPAPFAEMMAGRSSQRLGQAGGMTQFGVNLVTLAPGARSSLRHWHRAEDELVMVTEGECTLVQDGGCAVMRPGEVACFPAGVADGHCFVNQSGTEAQFLVIGTKVPVEVATYPDVDFVLTMRGTEVTFARRDGSPYVETPQDATLPPLPPAGQPRGLLTLPDWVTDNPTHPVTGPGPGPYRYQLLSDPGGLTQFGAFIEELPPGSSSGHRHWHEAEDEMILMLSGAVILVEETETTLTAGDAAAWPAGQAVGHRLDNRSGAPARYLVIGTRSPRDRIHYTDHDLVTETDGPARRYLHRDGTPYGETP